MVLVDTSVWIVHFREGISDLQELLGDTSVATHPFIIGELACGKLNNRKEILSLLQKLPPVNTVHDEEILTFIEDRKLMGMGIGLIDVHLLASSLLTNIPLWTFDTQLEKAAIKLNINYLK